MHDDDIDLYPSLHENLHSVSTTMSTPLVESEALDVDDDDDVEGEQIISPFRGGCNDGQRRNTHLENETCFSFGGLASKETGFVRTKV